MIKLSPMRDTGGPAFPLHNHGSQTLGLHVTGMTLRDYFAAKVMQGILAGNYPITEKIDCNKFIAISSYEMADAMLKARTA